VKLSTTEKVVAGVASVAALGALTYVLVGKSAAAAGPGAPGSSCWQPMASPFTLVPGTYRLAVAIPAAQQASLQTQWTQLGSQLAALQTALPSLRVTGVWAEGLAYPSGTPFPSDWPGGSPGPNTLCIQLSTGYTTAGTPYASQTLPAGLSIWTCTTGPVPAAAALPPNLMALLTQLGTLLGGSSGGTTGGTQQTPSGYTPATNVPAGFNPTATIPIPYTAGQPQTVDLVTPGETYSAVAIQGGTLNVIVAGPVSGVAPSPAMSGWSQTGNEVQITLSGQPGTIVVNWGSSSTQFLVQAPIAWKAQTVPAHTQMPVHI